MTVLLTVDSAHVLYSMGHSIKTSITKRKHYFLNIIYDGISPLFSLVACIHKRHSFTYSGGSRIWKWGCHFRKRLIFEKHTCTCTGWSKKKPHSDSFLDIINVKQFNV